MRYSPVFALSDLVAIAGYGFTFLAAVVAAVIAMYGDRKRTDAEHKRDRLSAKAEEQGKRVRELGAVFEEASLSVAEALSALGRRRAASGPEERSASGNEFNATATDVERAAVRIARVGTEEAVFLSYARARATVSDLRGIAQSTRDQLLDDNQELTTRANAARAVLAYGVFFSMLLALIYAPVYIRFQLAGRALVQHYAKLEQPGHMKWASALDRRKELQELLQLGVTPTASFQAGVAILAPPGHQPARGSALAGVTACRG